MIVTTTTTTDSLQSGMNINFYKVIKQKFYARVRVKYDILLLVALFVSRKVYMDGNYNFIVGKC